MSRRPSPPDAPSSGGGREAPRGWLARHPAVPVVAAAAGLLALVQGVFLALRNQTFGPEAAFNVARLGLVGGLLTVLLLVPAVLLLRRLHPAWRRGDRLQASWSVCFGLTAAIAAWMLVDPWAREPLLPAWSGPSVQAILVLVSAAWAFRSRPSLRFLKRAALLAPLALVITLLPPWGPPGAEPEPDGAAPPADVGMVDAEAPDVVLVSIDTLRADRLGAYGRSPSITPEMDRLAGEGLVFERVLAASPWTVPSVASLLTGLPTVRHGAGLPLGPGPTFQRSPLGGEFTTLAERFAAAGYRTRAVVANGFLTHFMGLAQGFEEFDTPLNRAMGAIFVRDLPLGRLLLALFPADRWGDYRAQGVTDKALAWLAEEDGAPLFLWVHYIDPHTPFQADPRDLDLMAWEAELRQLLPEVRDDRTVVGEVFAGTSQVRGGLLWLGPEDRRRIEEYYDRAVRYVDENVGRLFAALRQRRVRRPVVAAVTSDHGEEFWDHGHFEHGHDYYREVTRVPLLLWGPEAIPAGRVVSATAGLVDVPATLLELAGLATSAPEAPDEGRSLVALWAGPPAGEEGELSSGAGSAEEPVVRFSGGNLYGLPAVLLEEGRWRFILRANGQDELYDVELDPQERHDRALDHPELVARYRAMLEPRLAVFLRYREEGPVELDPETLKSLKALGYVQ